MTGTSKTVALIISIAANALFCLFLALAFTVKSASFSFYEPDASYLAAAAVAVLPVSGTVVFNTVEITIKQGEQAALQFSVIANRKQANWLIHTLYDHDIIAVEPSGHGVMINALRPGETVMQTLSEDGFKDVARITVLE
jgi:hypothetical protein